MKNLEKINLEKTISPMDKRQEIQQIEVEIEFNKLKQK